MEVVWVTQKWCKDRKFSGSNWEVDDDDDDDDDADADDGSDDYYDDGSDCGDDDDDDDEDDEDDDDDDDDDDDEDACKHADGAQFVECSLIMYINCICITMSSTGSTVICSILYTHVELL